MQPEIPCNRVSHFRASHSLTFVRTADAQPLRKELNTYE
jgi:hypothetical protein